MRDKILHVVGRVLGIPVNQLSQDSSPENIEAWDSLKHMNLVLALEEEFGVHFSDETIVEMLSVRLITEAVQELLPQTKNASQR